MREINQNIIDNINFLKVEKSEQVYEELYSDLKKMTQIIVKKYHSSKIYDDTTLDLLGHLVASDIILKLMEGKNLGIKNWYLYLSFFVKAYLPNSKNKHSILLKQEPNLVDRLDIMDLEHTLPSSTTMHPDYNIKRRESLKVLILSIRNFISDRLFLDDKRLINYLTLLNICLIFCESNLEELPLIGRTAEIIRLIFTEDLKKISNHGILKWI